jgi:MOSC domain-containing protein YiiM
MAATLEREIGGELIRKAGIMGIVVVGGEVRSGDPIRIDRPPEPHFPLKPV